MLLARNSSENGLKLDNGISSFVLFSFFVFARSDMACQMAIKAVQTVSEEEKSGRKVIDIKRYVRIEKVCVYIQYLIVTINCAYLI